ncbi:MAG TPA: peroxidase family protein, partial [Solirubrobacteraceae bacterium]|nr:peroxidase family protein [Solirubrobacteraceae bacterium]
PSTLQVGGTPMSIKDTMFKTELLTRHGIGRLIEDASKQPAGKIALYNTDAWLHHFTTRQSVTESRGLNLDSYNEYRKAVKLPPKKSFAQISPDRRVQADLRRLYGKVDDVELYAGLYAEEPIRGSVVPELMGVMVGIHAFSQLMTSPLLAPEVYNEATFSPAGMEMIRSTGSLATVVNRNPRGGKHYVSLTRRDWPQ